MSVTTDVGRFVASSSVRLATSQDGAMLLDVDQGQCFNINRIGTLIWTQLNQGCQIDQIAQRIADGFHIPVEQAKTDVQEFVLQLRQRQLLRDPDPPHAATDGTNERTMNTWATVCKWVRGMLTNSSR